jgi:hypothetical protein
MGLFDAFLAEGHVPCYGNRAVWGNADPVEADFTRDPDGPGWHLDRARFDGWLRRAAIACGARILTPARLVTIQRIGEGWRAQLATVRGQVDVAAGPRRLRVGLAPSVERPTGWSAAGSMAGRGGSGAAPG